MIEGKAPSCQCEWCEAVARPWTRLDNELVDSSIDEQQIVFEPVTIKISQRCRRTRGRDPRLDPFQAGMDLSHRTKTLRLERRNRDDFTLKFEPCGKLFSLDGTDLWFASEVVRKENQSRRDQLAGPSFYKHDGISSARRSRILDRQISYAGTMLESVVMGGIAV